MLAAATQAPRESQPPPATATIRGRVVAADTGQPLRRAEVHLNQVDSERTEAAALAKRESRAISTDGDGRYEFRNLGAGRYYISVNRAPYVSDTRVKPLELRAGEALDQVDFTLPRGGVITGRIVDEFGEPLPGLEMIAMRMQMMNGKRQLVETGGRGMTNDIGEFRLYGIDPGPYFLQAMWRRRSDVARSQRLPADIFPRHDERGRSAALHHRRGADGQRPVDGDVADQDGAGRGYRGRGQRTPGGEHIP
jgi:protocatechuate 3,4-dioxygenase beta subunit